MAGISPHLTRLFGTVTPEPKRHANHHLPRRASPRPTTGSKLPLDTKRIRYGARAQAACAHRSSDLSTAPYRRVGAVRDRHLVDSFGDGRTPPVSLDHRQIGSHSTWAPNVARGAIFGACDDRESTLSAPHSCVRSAPHGSSDLSASPTADDTGDPRRGGSRSHHRERSR